MAEEDNALAALRDSSPAEPPSDKEEEEAHLEVQVGTDALTGEPVWKDQGPVHLLDAPSPSSRTQLPPSVKRWFGITKSTTKHERQNLYLYRHAPNNAPNTNLLILLHGSGDSHRPFDKLATKMQLPQTSNLSMSASKFVKLPFNLGYTWFQEMDYNSGEVLPRNKATRQSSLNNAVEKMCDLLELLSKTGWILPERIFLLGYGAGASLIMATCHAWCTRYHRPALGGAVCVAGGELLSESKQSKESTTAAATPILLLAGAQDESFSPSLAKQVATQYERECASGAEVNIHVEPNKKQGMISSESEMRVVMEFLAPKLVQVSTMGQT